MGKECKKDLGLLGAVTFSFCNPCCKLLLRKLAACAPRVQGHGLCPAA